MEMQLLELYEILMQIGCQGTWEMHSLSRKQCKGWRTLIFKELNNCGLQKKDKLFDVSIVNSSSEEYFEMTRTFFFF